MGIMDNEGHDPQGFGNARRYDEADDLRSANKLLHSLLTERDADRERLRGALSALLVEYVAGRKEGHIDSFPATARKVVADARKALGEGKPAKSEVPLTDVRAFVDEQSKDR